LLDLKRRDFVDYTYILAGIMALGLLIYLIYVLIYPEAF